jgi:hypothetical protein
MNQRIIKHGLDSGMLNYVDHETPRHYFLSAHADEQCLEKFAELIVRECIDWCDAHATVDGTATKIAESIREHFGVER